MKFEKKVNKAVISTVTDYLETGKHSHIVLEYQVKDNAISSRKITTVENSEQYLYENGYECIGFKCFMKKARINTKYGYIVFETERIAGTIGCIDRDLENIEADALIKSQQ